MLSTALRLKCDRAYGSLDSFVSDGLIVAPWGGALDQVRLRQVSREIWRKRRSYSWPKRRTQQKRGLGLSLGASGCSL